MSDGGPEAGLLKRVLVPRDVADPTALFAAGVARGLRRRRRHRALIGVALAFLSGATAVLLWRAPGRVPAGPSSSPPDALARVQGASIAPGILADAIVPSDYSVARRPGESGVLVDLRRGTLRFEVLPGNSGTLRVRIGDVEVIDIGTVFEVSASPELVSVRVEKGSVRMTRGANSYEVTAGGHRTLSLAAVSVPRPAHSAASSAPRVKEVDQWRTLARQGQYRRAYEAVATDHHEGLVRDEPGDLLLWADVLRLSGHADRAAISLQDLLTRFPADPRSTTAAFTLGRVLMDDLGKPAAAAQAFLRSERLAGRGGLAEDALARAALAYYRAGLGAQGKECAQRYLERYPNGQHRAALEQLASGR